MDTFADVRGPLVTDWIGCPSISMWPLHSPIVQDMRLI